MEKEKCHFQWEYENKFAKYMQTRLRVFSKLSASWRFVIVLWIHELHSLKSATYDKPLRSASRAHVFGGLFDELALFVVACVLAALLLVCALPPLLPMPLPLPLPMPLPLPLNHFMLR